MNSALADRINAMAESATIAMANKARELKSQGVDVISLSLGEPDFKTPRHICEAAKQAIDEGLYFAYPPVPGYPDLRKAIAGKLKAENGIECAPENIVVSNGAKHSIMNVMLCLLNPGDEVVVLAPYWVSYVEMIRLAEAEPVIISGGIDQEFKVTADQLESAITPKTKAIIYSSPCNPTGAVFSRIEMEAFARVLNSHPGIYAIADEIYEYINFTGEHVSMATLPGMADRTITVNGFSKGHAMTGWRVGYVAAPKWLASACNKMQGQFTSGVCGIAQRAALAALNGDPEPTRQMAATYRRRRELVLEMLRQIPGIVPNNPEGAFYVFPDVSAYFGKSYGAHVIRDAEDLCMYLLNEAHVSVVGGAAFGAPECLRISYAASDEQLVESLKRIRESLARLN
jgi:aspartate aminotransferase